MEQTIMVNLDNIRKFREELTAVIKKQKPEPADNLILHCVRVALDDPKYEFVDGAERSMWKSIGFDIVYGMHPHTVSGAN
jgi:hypothetical protein